jgi:hypothetical protein
LAALTLSAAQVAVAMAARRALGADAAVVVGERPDQASPGVARTQPAHPVHLADADGTVTATY